MVAEMELRLEQTSPGVAQAGYDFGHSLIPALAVLAVVILLVRFVRKRRKPSSAPAAAGPGDDRGRTRRQVA